MPPMIEPMVEGRRREAGDSLARSLSHTHSLSLAFSLSHSGEGDEVRVPGVQW